MDQVADNSLSSPGQSAGRILGAARQRQGLSVADVARHLRLSVRQIEALEADDYDKLPGCTFVRGFIRNYAKLLQIDAEPLLESIKERMPSRPAQRPVQESREIPFPSKGRKTWRKYAATGLLVVLMVPVLLYEALWDKPLQRITVKPVAKEAIALPQPLAQSAGPVTLPSGGGAAVAGGVQAQGQTQAAAQPPADGGPPQTRAGLIRLAFDQDSWVEIRDKDGHRIFARVNPAGSEQLVQGNPPFSLIIGNASHVKVEYNDKPIDLAPHTRVDVARLTLE